MPKFYYEPSLRISGPPAVLYKTPSTGGKEALVIPGKEMRDVKRRIYFLGGEAGSTYEDVFGYDITLEEKYELDDPKEVFKAGGFYDTNEAILDEIKIYELGDIKLYQNISNNLPNYALVKDLNKFLSVLVPIFEINPNNQNFDENTKNALTSAALADVMSRYDYDVDQNGTVDAKNFYFLKKAYESKHRPDIESDMPAQDESESASSTSSPAEATMASTQKKTNPKRDTEINPGAMRASDDQTISGVTETGYYGTFNLVNVYSKKNDPKKFSIFRPEVKLTKKIVKRKDRFTLIANDFILIPVRLKAPISEAKKYWGSLVLNSPTAMTRGTSIVYVPIRMIEWTYDSTYKNYGNAQPRIELIHYEPRPSMPSEPTDVNMASVAYANAAGVQGEEGRDAVAQGIFEYLTKPSVDIDPGSVTLYATSALRSEMNKYPIYVSRFQ